jgi:DNA-binding transcriptional regulator YdaS (Cro superfamily)
MVGMTPKQVIQHYGAGKVPAAAKAMGLTPATLYLWRALNRIPNGRQAMIELATDGKLKADK